MKMTQRERIEKYLDDFGSINAFEALQDLGIMRLAPRISEMIRSGYKVEKIQERFTNRYGEHGHCTRYRKAAE